MLSKFFASGCPLSAAFCFNLRCNRQRFHREATLIESILNLTDNPVFGKKYPQFSRAAICRFRTGPLG
jgi:hypothetical protein